MTRYPYRWHPIAVFQSTRDEQKVDTALKHYDLREPREINWGFPLTVYQIDHVPGRKDVMHTHWHAEHEIVYVVRGSATFRVGESAFEMGPGDFCFVNSGQTHGGNFAGSEGCLYRAIVFRMSLLSSNSGDDCDLEYISRLAQNKLRLSPFHPFQSAKRDQLQESIQELVRLWDERPPAFKLRIKGTLYSILSDMVEGNLIEESQDDESYEDETMVQKVMDHIASNLGSKVTLDELSSFSHMSKYHFCRWFKSYTGMRPLEFVNSARIHKAAGLLSIGTTLSDTATQVGFNDMTYFSRVFKEYMEVSPTAFQHEFRSR